VHAALRHFAIWLLHLGAFGPLILGVLDSSFLFLPFGNDLLVIGLVARDHRHSVLYVLSAAIGSTMGVYLLDVVSRKGGEEGLKKLMSPSRFERLKKSVEKGAGGAIAIAAIAPPPFPFTLVVAAASAFQYPRKKLLSTVFAARLVRFSILAALAVRFGPGILRIANSSGFTWLMFALLLIGVVGTFVQLLRRARTPRAEMRLVR